MVEKIAWSLALWPLLCSTHHILLLTMRFEIYWSYWLITILKTGAIVVYL
jgi:hypothetical protein